MSECTATQRETKSRYDRIQAMTGQIRAKKESMVHVSNGLEQPIYLYNSAACSKTDGN